MQQEPQLCEPGKVKGCEYLVAQRRPIRGVIGAPAREFETRHVGEVFDRGRRREGL